MTTESKAGQVGSWRLKYLATCFGSKDGSINGVKNRFDRQRLHARIRYEERMGAQWLREVNFRHGSADGSLANVPQENRKAALAEDRHEFARLQTFNREQMKRPTLLAGRMALLLQPFKEEFKS